MGPSTTTLESAAATLPPARHYSRGEEIANSVTHGIGTLLALAGLVVLVVLAAMRGGALLVVSSALYGATLVLLYLASTLYHALTHPRLKHVFHVLDHAGIYLLIAGTYTPFTLVSLRGAWGWSIFGTIWGCAILGVSLEAWWVGRPKWLSAAVYVAMGWIIIVAVRPLVAAVPSAGLWLLFGGGVVYTGGTLFYVLRRPRYMHAVWHMFVIGGSVCHYLAILLYVLPRAG